MKINNTQFTTPILLIIFNRPDKARTLFAKIREIKPTKLFIAADGPRSYKAGEDNLCEETRSVIKDIDWPCEIHTDFLDHNIGCDERVPSAITWFFEQVENGIIFEDDCIPHKDFFYFCQELLEKYSSNEKIMMISGNNFQDGNIRGNGSYYFSRYPNTWGWATWKRAWKKYDHTLKNAPSIKTTHGDEHKYWSKFYTQLKSGKYTFWDAKWLFSIWQNNSLSITPNMNLVSNIGFGKDSTHTKTKDASLERPTNSLEYIIHPKEIKESSEADRYLFVKVYKTSLLKKIQTKIRLLLQKI